MSIREGVRVSYVGDGGGHDRGLAVGDRGKVLAAAGSGAHVLWSTGQRSGETLLVANEDLVSMRTTAHSYDDLDSNLVTIQVRATYDHGGSVALLNALNDEGHLATLTSVAEEALQMVASRLRTDPSFAEVLGQLDADEGAEFVSFAAACLLRDAFTEEGE